MIKALEGCDSRNGDILDSGGNLLDWYLTEHPFYHHLLNLEYLPNFHMKEDSSAYWLLP